jgi:hypothetical protein
VSERHAPVASWQTSRVYPRRAASIAATSIFFIDIMAEKARFASAPRRQGRP